MNKRKPDHIAPDATRFTDITGAARPMAFSDVRQDPTALRAEAAELTRRALAEKSPYLAERALAVRAEARACEYVIDWERPRLDGDAGAAAPGRGRLEAVEVASMVYSAKTDRLEVATNRVAKRAVAPVLAKLTTQQQAIAGHYEALVAQLGAVRCMDPGQVGGGGGRVSDGGATAKLADAEELARIVAAIGEDAALYGRNSSAHADRARRPITYLELVDGVCLSALSLDTILARAGWSRRHNHRQALMTALRAALDRAYGVSIFGD